MKKILILGILILASIPLVNAEEYTFSKDLTVGYTGEDVSALQSWLIVQGFDIPALSLGQAPKGYFGAQTKAALMRYQQSEQLPMTGYFGRMTRNRIHEREFKRTDARSPIINGVDAPTVLNVGETGTWKVRATDPQNGTLSYSVDWGEVISYPAATCPVGYACDAAGLNIPPPPPVQQDATFSHSYSSSRTYKVTFSVKNSLGLTTQSIISVNVVNPSASPLNIISPNGGETWEKGTSQTVRWNAPAYFRATYADITIIEYQYCPNNALCKFRPALTYPIAKNISINQNSFTWKVGDYIPEVMTMIYPPVYPTVPDGQYLVQICETGTNNCDTSNKPFTVSSVANPQVTKPNGGESWVSKTTQELRWNIPTSMSMSTRLDLYLDQAGIYCIKAPCGTTYVLDKNIPITMIYNWIVATDINDAKIPDGTYTFRVCLAGSTTNCDSSDQSFKIVTELLKVCPSSKVINQMPTPVGPNQNPPSVYYILNGQRKELTEFDSNWVQYNCVVSQQVVY